MPKFPQLRVATTGDRRRVAEICAWYERHARALPWREPDCSPWGVLVSEVMLQQTPVARVEPVWREWMARWPTPADLAGATQADAVRAWGRLGYPRRALRLWECAREVVERWDGRVPTERDALLSLPGVGDYTAAAVQAFAFGARAVVVDTNVRRVLARAWSGEPLPALSITRAERDLAASLVPSDAGAAAQWAAASMELGALVCTARAPRCDACPVAGECAWVAQGRPGLADAPRRTQAWHGTDRQVRGTVLRLLRDSTAPVVPASHDELAHISADQLARCVDSLLADGLVVRTAAEGALALAGEG